jgi:hypothetical protein
MVHGRCLCFSLSRAETEEIYWLFLLLLLLVVVLVLVVVVFVVVIFVVRGDIRYPILDLFLLTPYPLQIINVKRRIDTKNLYRCRIFSSITYRIDLSIAMS